MWILDEVCVPMVTEVGILFYQVKNNNIATCSIGKIAETYLEPGRISTMKLFLQKQLTANRR